MNRVLDTSFLIGRTSDSIQELSRIRTEIDEKLVIDLPDGPCISELERHSPRPLRPGRPWRRPRATERVMAPHVRSLLTRVIGREDNIISIANHDGEPHGELCAQLRKLILGPRAQDWWEKDRKWVSLAQRAGGALIFTCDGGFIEFKSCLRSHSIDVQIQHPAQSG